VTSDDIRDPRVVPRWMPVGVHGVARAREWDAVFALELPELEGDSLSELAFKLLRDGTVLGDVEGVPADVVDRLAALAREESGLPAEVRAVRTGVRDWSAAVRRTRLELLALPELDASELALAVPPGGERTLLADGEEVEPQGALAEAADVLELRGRERYRTFVARATRVAGGWELTIDPL
jgi:hypothetical protein